MRGVSRSPASAWEQPGNGGNYPCHPGEDSNEQGGVHRIDALRKDTERRDSKNDPDGPKTARYFRHSYCFQCRREILTVTGDQTTRLLHRDNSSKSGRVFGARR